MAASGVRIRTAKKHKKNVDTFESIAREWLTLQTWTVQQTARVRGTLVREVFAEIGSLPMRAVRAGHVASIIDRLEDRGLADMARDVRHWCGVIFAFAARTGRAERGRRLAGASRAKRSDVQISKHQLAQICRRIDEFELTETRIGLKLLLLLFVRPNELWRAEWTEFDLEHAEWRIPAEKMKLRKRHVVPLSPQVIELVRALHDITGTNKQLFPRQRTTERSVTATLRAIECGEDLSARGFRAVASTLLKELGFRWELIEVQLGYDRNDAESYDEYDCIAERREMMKQYANMIDRLRAQHSASALDVIV